MMCITFKVKGSPLTVFFFYYWLIVLAYVGTCYDYCNFGGFVIEEATIEQIQAAFKAGNLNSTQLVECYLQRIRTLNPQLNAVIEVNPDARSLAELADAERLKPGASIGSLHGIPVLLKDNIATADKLNTTSGSFALLGSKVPRDAGVVSKLRNASAIILGKASLSEWAGFRSSYMPAGWSARGGQAKNPYKLTADPCGSSTGSAVAVAANMVAVSLGTETDSSIICPSSVNSVVGIKPTVGLTSRSGVIPISNSQDTVGPIGRTVADAVYVLDEIVGYDARDPNATNSSAIFIPKGGYKQFLNKPDGLQGKKLGIFRHPYFDYGSNSSIALHFKQHLNTLRDSGATLVDNVTIANISDILNFESGEQDVLMYEFKHYLNVYLSELNSSPVRTLADIIAFNKNHSQENVNDIGQDLLEKAQNTSDLNSDTYKNAVKRVSTLTTIGIDKLLKDYNLDAVLSLETARITFSSVIAIAGYPGITVPAGYDASVPFAISFAAGRGKEPTLIQIADAFERATKERKKPNITVSAILQRSTPETETAVQK